MWGINLYQYAPSPLGWVDPWRLSCTFKVTNPQKLINDLKGFSDKNFHIGNQTFKLDRAGMKHILERYHPEYWNGSTKAQQSFLSNKMSINDVSDAIGDVIKQNRDVLISKGSRGMYQIKGTYGGVEYTLGINKGRIGQFYPN